MTRNSVARNIGVKILDYCNSVRGRAIECDLAAYAGTVEKIKALGSAAQNRSDSQLRSHSELLAARARSGESLDDLLVEAFAVAGEAARRVLGIRPHDVQMIGGIAMHEGKIAEMQTGEGKTLAAVFPAFLNALTGEGVHVLTFNDYLARRDARWMGPVYTFLGLRVGEIQEGMPVRDRQRAYNSDITYLTAKESGFDFLRDTLGYTPDAIVHRALNVAIIDEADSLLIDEARIPLVLAGAADGIGDGEDSMTQIARLMKKTADYEFDEYQRNIYLTENGIRRAEEMLGCGNLFDEENIELLTRLNYALHAEYLLHPDRDYIVRNGKVELVDEFTGRIADSRRWPDGLQDAIEAKEKIAARSKGRLLNSITLHHFFRRYRKTCGMTATALPSAEELGEFYNLPVVVIPPDRPCIRRDHDDVIFATKEEKQSALLEEIIIAHGSGRPVLVGTGSIEESAVVAGALRERGVPCEVLNAKHDEREAMIIAGAGAPGAVTISTNMAGRGTDIRLGGSDESQKKLVAELGGLYVIGTTMHESRRIDAQLRGRAGRQGDPGSSRFFISLEDDIFTRYRLMDSMAAKHAFAKNGIIDDPFTKKMIQHIQRVVEGQNFEIRKTLSRYSLLLEKQRTIMSQRRADILHSEDPRDFYRERSPDKFHQLTAAAGEEELIKACRHISLHILDENWSRFLSEISDIRESIHLERIGGREPVIQFYKQSIELHEMMEKRIETDMIKLFNSLDVNDGVIDLQDERFKAPSATWTYLVNDNPFKDGLLLKELGNWGFNAMAGIVWPLIALYPFLKKIARKRR